MWVSWIRETAVRLWPAIALISGIIVLELVSTLVGSRLVDRTITDMMIKVVLVVGLYIFMGNSGIVSFGHMAFAMIGAYAVVWQTCCAVLKPTIMPGLPHFLAYNTVPLLPALFIAGLLAMVVALLISILIMRLNGLAAGIATFAFLIIANVVYSNWQSMTRGTSSIVGIPVYVTTEVAMIWAAIAILVANIYQTTRYGTMLRATRDDNVAAASSGIDVRRQRTISFVISAFLSGIGGALYAHYLGAVSVDAFYLELTFMTLAMLVVGGSGSLTGAVMGVVIISTVRELLRSLEGGLNVPGATIQLPLGTQEICVGLAMLLIIMFRPQGLFGNSEIRAPNWLSSRLVRRQLAA